MTRADNLSQRSPTPDDRDQLVENPKKQGPTSPETGNLRKSLLTNEGHPRNFVSHNFGAPIAFWVAEIFQTAKMAGDWCIFGWHWFPEDWAGKIRKP